MALLMASDRRARYALGLVKRSRLSGVGKSAEPANFTDVWRRSNGRRRAGAAVRECGAGAGGWIGGQLTAI